ncbi:MULTISPECIES: ABC transporter ATP-binding protein [Thalassobaculum]|uniref:Carbohydrate ABC transporter ATP-binding protein, CUT1 family (TC 3.A.1.1.-) n=1 Tax=Thalassobaculum litoreum DSM 18839 TaxID=1123362 RepID=A0A8G2BNN7_9PROT|nr:MULTISPECIES: ABC transporter ATP-binding protein [Thalassobaculum]SDG36490.1 carbohydrate ABC transporter ATP-binding protein, CUT1 family (TC 3.A.1.1.-) [Thalassobaculum litoreum DSM 18839]
MAKITLSNLAHSYAGAPASRDDYQLKPTIDHVWDDGEAYALLGPSGCGKTTLLNIISGLLVPSQGRILFDDTDVTALSTAARNVAQVFQFPVVYDTMTVYENLAFPLRNRGGSAAYVDRRVKTIAEMIGMTGDLDRRAHGLTADAKQKISLGRGMVREDVSAILFDEPLTVIDPHMKWELRTELKTLHREFGHTMIYVTHDQTEALTFADKVVVMLDGEVVQLGTPVELFERPEHTFVGFFIGSPGMNVLPATVEGDTAFLGGHAVPLGRAFSHAGADGIEIGVRPEFVSLSDGDDGLPIKVTRVEDVGRHLVVRTDFDGTEVNVIAPEGASISDRHNRILFDPQGIHVYSDGWIVDSDRRAARGGGKR